MIAVVQQPLVEQAEAVGSRSHHCKGNHRDNRDFGRWGADPISRSGRHDQPGGHRDGEQRLTITILSFIRAFSAHERLLVAGCNAMRLGAATPRRAGLGCVESLPAVTVGPYVGDRISYA